MFLSRCCLWVLRWLGRLQTIVRQLPSSGHAFFFRQLHVFLLLMVAAAAVSLVGMDEVRMRLSIICFMLFMQL